MTYTADKLQSMIVNGRLNLWGTKITDLGPLAGLTGLTGLNLGGTAITKASIAAIRRPGLTIYQ
jgi:hypothetical protein